MVPVSLGKNNNKAKILALALFSLVFMASFSSSPAWAAGIDSYTVLMLHCDGGDGSTTFTDATGIHVPYLPQPGENGNDINVNTVKISQTLAKLGNASGHWNGPNLGTLYINDNPSDFNFGNGDFTIDFWVNSIRQNTPLRNDCIGATNYCNWLICNLEDDGSGITQRVVFGASTNGATYDIGGAIHVGTIPIEDNTWTHIAVVRHGSNWRVYVNGQVDIEFTSSATLQAAPDVTIGGHLPDNYALNGYMDEIRISKGIARWTSNFTPPTSAYSTSTGPKILYVDGVNGNDANSGLTTTEAFQTINSAEAAALSGDEIHVKQGTYNLTATITIKSGVYLRGGYNASWVQTGALTAINGGLSVQCMSGEALSAATTIENFTIENGISDYGAGLYLTGSSPTIKNCTFYYNIANNSGGGIYNNVSTPEIQNCVFNTNYANNLDGGGICNSSSSPTIQNCTFESNAAWNDGGGICNSSSSSPTITNCTFTSYNNANHGGGLYNSSSSSPTIINCTFISSIAYLGGGLFNDSSSPTIKNCTIISNSASGGGGGIFNASSSSPIIKNTIIYGNTGGSIYDLSSTPTVKYSCIEGGYTGTGNITFEPFFVDAPGNLHLRAESPCIDTATSEGAPSADIEENNRPTGAGYDMGAYEFQGASVTVIQPNGGETLVVGTSSNITWEENFEANEIYIRLSTNGGSTWDTLITHETGSYSGAINYPWIVNNVPSTACLISVEALGSGYQNHDASDAVFVIRSPKTFYVNAASPAGGDGSQASPFKTINSAEAAALGGDEIHVKQGTYSLTGVGTITLKSGVYLRGGYDGSWNQTSEVSTTIISGEGTVRCMSGSGLTAATTIENFTINNGGAPGGSGGGLYLYSSSPNINNCAFTSNSAYNGGGIYNSASNTTFTNCIFTSNQAAHWGGGIWNADSSPTSTNCTFNSNSAASHGAGICNSSSSSPIIKNSIIYGNTSENIYNNDGGSVPTVTYSCIGGGYTGTGNISAEPLFVSPPGDLHLLSTSECINSGTAVGAPAIDLDWISRPQGSGYDMGAYEYHVVESSYTTKVGTLGSWEWRKAQPGESVPSGTPADWQLRTWQSGSGRKVPQGTAPTWNWGNE